MESDRVPYISDDLLEYLQRVFPDKCPDLTATDRKVWYDAGAVSVVRHIAKLHEEQRENMLGV